MQEVDKEGGVGGDGLSPLLPPPRAPTYSFVGLAHLCEFRRADEPELLCPPAGKYDGPARSPGTWREDMWGLRAGSSDPG